MRYEEFRQLACCRPYPDTPGFYKLEWFKHKSDAQYLPNEILDGVIWEYQGLSICDIGNYEYYPSFGDAHQAMKRKVGTEGIDGFVIRKLGYGPQGIKDFYIYFTSYDGEGTQILQSVCSSYHYNQPGLAGKFIGRDEKTTHFKLGDIVQYDRCERNSMWKKCTLGIVVGLPRSVEDYWELYEEDVEELGRQEADKKWFEEPSIAGSDDDEYFIQFGPFEPVMHNFTFRNAVGIRLPALTVPDNVRASLIGYYKDYMDYLNFKDE